MRKVMLALALVGLAGSASAQEPHRRAVAKPAEREDADPYVIEGRCGVFVKWVGMTLSTTSVSEQQLAGEAIAETDLRWSMVEFWNGPYYLEDAKTQIQQSTLTGHWGALLIDGQHNSAYSAEFFPPARIKRMRWEYDCRG
jgi:hypothetical protein